MPNSATIRRTLGWTLVVCAAGCAELRVDHTRLETSGRLKAAHAPLDSVGLDVIFVRSRLDDEKLNRDLWNQVDEQKLPADVRRALADHGMRAGIVSTPLPACLEELLALADKPKTSGNTLGDEGTVADLQADPAVTGRHLHIRAGQPTEVQTSRVYEQLPLLRKRADEVVGDMLTNAQGVFVVTSQPQPGGTVQVKLLPQIHWGDPRQVYAPSQQGIWKFEMSRRRIAFDELELTAGLKPGELLLIACLPEQTGSLGQQFFTDRTKGTPEQKLLLLRVNQATASLD